jgi:polar amino acid transport system substrate-binding protein
MKHLAKALSLFAVLPLALHLDVASARTMQEIQASKTLNIVTTASSPPHGFMDPASNSLKGIMVEVGEAVAKRLGVSPNYTNVPFAGLIPTLTSGRADLMSAPLFITEERAQAVDFSVPIYGWGEGIVVSDKAPQKYPNMDALKGKKVGTLVDSVQYKMIKDMPGTQVATYPDYPALLADVRVGRIDLGVVDPPSILYQIRTRNIPGVVIDDSYKAQKVFYVGAAAQKGNKELVDAVNKALADMKSSGELQKILAKWGVGNLEAK